MSMFGIDGDRHDVFISYATTDNARFPSYIDNFRSDLSDQLSAHPKLKDLRGREPEIYKDTEDLELTGSIEAHLEESVSRTTFLVLMVTENYFASDWCFKEFGYFRDRLDGKLAEVGARTFFVVLEKSVAAKTQKWLDEEFGSQAPRYIEFFDEEREDRPRKRGSDGDIDEDYSYEVGRIAGRMAKLYREIAPQGSPRSVGTKASVSDSPRTAAVGAVEQAAGPEAPPKALLGVVTSDLAAARDRLRQQLEQQQVETLVLEPEHLKRKQFDAMKESIDSLMIYIQLVSYAPPLADEYRDLGHLEIQQENFEKLGGKRPHAVLWCHPEGEPGVVSRAEADGTEDEVLEFIDARIKEGAFLSLDEIAKTFCPENEDEDPHFYKVLVECPDEDKKVGRELRDALTDLWLSKYEDVTPPLFVPLPWKKFSGEDLQDCMGVILIYGTKDERSFKNQVEGITKSTHKKMPKLVKRVAYAPPQGEDPPDYLWDSFWYNESSGLEEVIDQIHEAIETPS